MGEEGGAGGVRFPADDVGDGDGVLGRSGESSERGTGCSGCSQGAQLIDGLVAVRNSGDAGLAGGLEGQEPEVMSTGDVASGF